MRRFVLALALLAPLAAHAQEAVTPPSGSSSLVPGTTTITGGGANRLLYDNGGTLSELATAASGVLVTDGSGAPSISTTLPNINLGTPTALVGTNISGTASGLTAGNVSGTGAGSLASLALSPAANTAGLTLSGGSHTGSDATGDVSISTTWNTSGSPKGFSVNVTNTASGSDARAFDVTVSGGVNLTLNAASGSLWNAGAGFVVSDGTNTNFSLTHALGQISGIGTFDTNSGGYLRWNSAANLSGSFDTFESRAAAGLVQFGTTSTNSAGNIVYAHPYTYSQPTTGTTVSMTTPQVTAFEYAIVDPAGTLAALTVTLPACNAAADSHISGFSSTQVVTALTVNAASGTVADAPGSLAVGGGNSYICRATGTKWFRLS